MHTARIRETTPRIAYLRAAPLVVLLGLLLLGVATAPAGSSQAQQAVATLEQPLIVLAPRPAAPANVPAEVSTAATN